MIQINLIFEKNQKQRKSTLQTIQNQNFQINQKTTKVS